MKKGEVTMEYEYMVSPIGSYDFANFTAKEAKEYFEWFMGEREKRVHILSEYIKSEGEEMEFDYTPESLIPLWTWFLEKIRFEKRSEEELKKERAKFPEWMQEHISEDRPSIETLKYVLDIAVYFGEVFVRNNEGKLYWGYKTKPKRLISVNRPTILGFKAGVDLEPIEIILTGVYRSRRERDKAYLYDSYYIWLEDIE